MNHSRASSIHVQLAEFRRWPRGLAIVSCTQHSVRQSTDNNIERYCHDEVVFSQGVPAVMSKANSERHLLVGKFIAGSRGLPNCRQRSAGSALFCRLPVTRSTGLPRQPRPRQSVTHIPVQEGKGGSELSGTRGQAPAINTGLARPSSRTSPGTGWSVLVLVAVGATLTS